MALDAILTRLLQHSLIATAFLFLFLFFWALNSILSIMNRRTNRTEEDGQNDNDWEKEAPPEW